MTELLTQTAIECAPWARHLERARWAHRTPTLQGLSLRFGVRSTDPRVGRYVDELLRSLRAPVPAAHWYSLVTGLDGRVDLLLDDQLVNHLNDAREAVDWLLWDINRAVVEASDHHLLLHAGGVQARDGGVLIPGPSGSGKTTLVAALVRSGLGYLSDEVIALTTSGATMLPYPKALAVKAGSFEALRDLEPRRALQSANGDSGAGPEGQWYVTPSEIRAGGVGRACGARIVLFPRYEPTSATNMRSLRPSEAFLALTTNTVNLHRHDSVGMQLITDLVENCDCYELVMSDLESACKLVLALLEEQG